MAMPQGSSPMSKAAVNGRSRLDAMLGGPGGGPSGQETKAAVHYRPAENPEISCEDCMHGQFLNGMQGTCQIVAGPILATDVCDRFAPEKQEEAPPAPGGAPGPMAG